MKKENSILMKEAREALSGKWGFVMGVCVLYFLITIAVQNIKDIGWILSMLISGPMIFGLTTFTLSFIRNEEAKISQIFDGFKIFEKTFIAYLLMVLFTLLWTLLLIVPGIIAAISYSQLFYILADDQKLSPKEALKKSKKMMYGYKWKYFCLNLRFLGWGILSLLTLGVGFLWLFPYVQVTKAKFYEELSKSLVTTEEPVA